MPDEVANGSHTLQVTVLIVYNGTYKTEDPALQIAEIVLLVIVLLVSFGTNAFLLATITSSYTLRTVPFNLLLANLSIVFLCETLLNISIALDFALVEAWKFGEMGCTLSSFSVQWVTMEVTFGLSIMCAESMASVCQPLRFQTYFTIKKQIVAIAILWTLGILLCLPLLLKSIVTPFFPSRYSCAPTGEGSFLHALFLTIWCYSLMISIGLGCLIYLGIRQYKQYKIRKKKHEAHYTDLFMQGDLWTDWLNLKLVAWLALFYMILELPYIVVHQTSALTNSKYDTELNNSTFFSEQTPTYEIAFTWFRYIYSCVFSCFVFYRRKDIRQKFRTLISCCYTNIVRDNSPLPVARQDRRPKPDKVNKKDSLIPLSLNTPVLYISPNGLCLRQLDPSLQLNHKYLSNEKCANPSFVSYLCDVDCSNFSEDSVQRLGDAFGSFNSEMLTKLSKESEISLPELESRGSSNRPSTELPAKDIELPTSMESEPIKLKEVKKSVRFADTLTIYRTLTPKSIRSTPDWITSENKTTTIASQGRRILSRIPTRIRPVKHDAPWKVELNSTFLVNTPSVALRNTEANTNSKHDEKSHIEGKKKSVSNVSNHFVSDMKSRKTSRRKMNR